MKGWGRASVLTLVGLALAMGCGGRTNTLDDGMYGDDDDNVGASGGTATQGGAGTVGGVAPRGGTSTRGGTTSRAGASTRGGSGPVPIGGVGPGGGTGPVPHGGSNFGGFGGAVVTGGTGTAFGGATTIGGTGQIGGFGGTGPQSCISCLQQSCTDEFVQCFQDAGCVSIFACVQQTGCNGLRCYRDEFCKGVIDQWGGPAGPSMKSLLQTVTCAVGSGCSCN